MATDLGSAPDFTLPRFDGGVFPLREGDGRVIVITFWASWCVPCRREASRFAAAAAYRDRGVVFVGVNIQDNETDARASLAEFGLAYPNGPDRDGAIAAAYGVSGIPATFFIDRCGQLRRRWLGERTERQLAAAIEELLR